MRPTPLRTAVRVGAILAVAAPLAVLGVRSYVRLTNRQFYRAATRRIALPGLSEGFIPQDLFYCKGSKTWLFSGYMNDGSASPLYRVGPNGAVSRLLVRLADGSTYSGHGAAITAAGSYAFLSVQDGYAVMNLDAVLSCEDGGFVQALAHVPLELVPAFMIVQHRTLYVGEFYYPVNFETPKSHHITTPDGTRNHAIMLAYPADPAGRYGFAEQAARVYSIPSKVQGMCITADGRMVMSRSWGLGDANLAVYDPARFTDDGTYRIDGRDTPLTCLDGRSFMEQLRVPPMSEGLDSRGNQVFLANEAASDRYVIGKFYRGGAVYSLEV